MNTKEFFITGNESFLNLDRERYILSDQRFNLILFSDAKQEQELTDFKNALINYYPSCINTTTGVIDVYADPLFKIQQPVLFNNWIAGSFTHNKTPLSAIDLSMNYIILDSSEYNQVIYDAESPIKITINPKLLNTVNKIYKIKYEFETETETQTFYYLPTSSDTSTLPFSAEPGDPRNFPHSSIYSLSDEFQNTYNIIVSFYQYGEVDPRVVVYTLKLKAKDVDGKLGYFDEIHLISNNLFGMDNTILYMFESYNPQYLLPTIVKWQNSTNTNVIKKDNLKRLSIKPYRLLQPYENNLQENTDIQSSELVSGYSYVIDEGYSQQNNIVTQSSGATGGYYLTTSNGNRLKIGNFKNNNLN